jgi:putative spermidine/putrescine transport system permease protein
MKRFNSFGFAITSLYLALPIISTALYAISTEWNRTVFPEGLTLKWISSLFNDLRFIEAFGRSVILSGSAVILAVILMIPAILIIVIYYPKYEKWIQSMVVMVYAFPPIILAVGLINSYSGTGLSMVLILLGAYVIGILPFMYQGTRNSLRNLNARELMDAAELLGAGKLEAFRRVLLPSIYPGIFVASILSFSVLFGEFVLVNLVVGSQFETVQIFLIAVLKSNGHIASAVVLIYIILMGATTVITAFLAKKSEGVTRG